MTSSKEKIPVCAARQQLLLLVLVVLAVYYPALTGSINSIDDTHIVEAYGINSVITLKDILVPGHKFYYRPVVELSYYLDNLFWAMDASFMHLENVLLHLANTLLVFAVARQLWNTEQTAPPSLPLLTALLFALHPVNCEAVSWIAGRTDPLAACFVLAAAFFLLKGVDDRKQRYLYLAVLLVFLGALAKEIAIFFLPCAAFLAFSRSRAAGSPAGRRVATASLRPFLLAPLALFSLFVGHLLFNKGANSVARLFEGRGGDAAGFLPALLKSFGFYVKKLFLPAPLNFAIDGVADGYLWLGLLALVLLALLAVRGYRDIYCAFLVTGFFLIAPALLVAVFKIAWTPVAERYLYLPSAFCAIGAVGLSYRLSASLGFVRWLPAALVPLLLFALFLTVGRVPVWQDNLTLYRDAVRQSPRFGALRNELGLALLQKGRVAEGEEQLEIGRRLDPDSRVKALMDYNLLLERTKGKSPEQTLALLHEAIKDRRRVDTRLLILLRSASVAKLGTTGDPAERILLTRDIIDTNNCLYAKNGDAASLYNNGQLSLSLGETGTAAEYFRRAHAAAPEGAHFKEAAGRLALKLGRH